jgi:hypothetical protein
MAKKQIVEGVEVTPSQAKAIGRLRKTILEADGEGLESPAYQRFDLTPSQSGFLVLEAVVAPKGSFRSDDPSTLRVVFIGERGAVELGNPKDPEDRGKIKGSPLVATAPVASV